MKFTTLATIASVFAVATAAPTPTTVGSFPTATVTVAAHSISPVFTGLSTIQGDVDAIIQDVQTITPLIIGDSSIPAEVVELVTALGKLAQDIAEIVGTVSGDLNSIIGAAAAA